MTTTPNQITLYKTEGSADKVYALSVIPAPEAPGLYLLMYSNGRRGSTLKTNRKTPNPVTFVEAKTEFDKVMRSKMKDATPSRATAWPTRPARTLARSVATGRCCPPTYPKLEKTSFCKI